MRTDEDLGRLLRESFRAEAARLSAGPVTVPAPAARRGRLAVAAIAIAVGLVPIGIAVLAQLKTTDPEPAPTPMQEPAGMTGTWRWATSLPRSAAPDLYLVGTTLYVDGLRHQLPGDDGELVGRSSEGPVVFLEDESPSGFSSGYVVVRADGSVDELPRLDYQVQNAAIDPTGTRIAYGDSVVDVATKQVVARLPDAARVLESWTDAGLYWGGVGRGSFIWRPGTSGPGARVEGSPGTSASATDRFVYGRVAGCTSAFDVDRRGVLTERARFCSDRPRTLSPSGRHVVARPLLMGVVDGALRPPVGLGREPSLFIAGEISWESARTFATAMYNVGGSVGVVIRCDVTTAECTRATPTLSVDRDDQIDLP